MSTIPRALLPLVVLAMLLAGCGDRSAPSAGEKRGVEGTLILHAPDAEGRRTATFQTTPATEVRNATVQFTLPADCQVQAGATVRHLPALPADKPFEAAVVFTCPEKSAGAVELHLEGKTPDGQIVTRSLRATF